MEVQSKLTPLQWLEFLAVVYRSPLVVQVTQGGFHAALFVAKYVIQLVLFTCSKLVIHVRGAAAWVIQNLRSPAVPVSRITTLLSPAVY